MDCKEIHKGKVFEIPLYFHLGNFEEKRDLIFLGDLQICSKYWNIVHDHFVEAI